MKVFILIFALILQLCLSNSFPAISELEEDGIYDSAEEFEERDIENPNQYECVLMNDYYKNEYLYSASSLHKVTFFMRYVFTWSPLIKVMFGSKRPNVFSDADKQGVWVFEPVQGKMNTFFIKNLKYGEYLYAQDALIGQSLSDRRRVLTWKSSKNDMDFKEYYMWTFERLNDGTFHVWNVAYNEALFAASHFYRKDGLRRSVFTWKHPPDSRQFNWNVKCRNDIEPFSFANNNYQ
jgi:hypothetical protein